MAHDRGQGQLRFPCLAVAGDAACEMSETHGLQETQVSSAVHTTKGLQSHQPETSANAMGQVNNTERLTQRKISDCKHFEYLALCKISLGNECIKTCIYLYRSTYMHVYDYIQSFYI